MITKEESAEEGKAKSFPSKGKDKREIWKKELFDFHLQWKEAECGKVFCLILLHVESTVVLLCEL